MKIYWTKKSIPELTNLPKHIRKRNYQEARRKASAHYEHWLGALLFVALIFILQALFYKIVPCKNGFWPALARAAFSVPVAALAWEQCTIYVMRKYYPHILIRKDAD